MGVGFHEDRQRVSVGSSSSVGEYVFLVLFHLGII